MMKRRDGPLRILVTGEPYFVRQLEHQLSGYLPHAVWLPELDRLSRWRKTVRLFRELLRADVWYQLHGCAGRGWNCELALRLGKPVVLHWLGTDVSDALRYFRAHPEHLPTLRRMTHWTFSPWLVEELAALGIQAEFRPFPQAKVIRYLQQETPPLPETFTVVTYIPDDRPDFYGWEAILHLAQRFPHLPVRVLKAEGHFASEVPSNITFLGWIEDPYPVLKNATLLVRITQHDGYSGMVQEALALGRYVIWTYPAPGVRQVRSETELMEQVQTLYEAHQRGTLALNLEGRSFVEKELHPRRAAERIVQGLEVVAAHLGERLASF